MLSHNYIPVVNLHRSSERNKTIIHNTGTYYHGQNALTLLEAFVLLLDFACIHVRKIEAF